MKKSIWVLTSVANLYDQPPNNLEAWWAEEPSEDQVTQALAEAGYRQDGAAATLLFTGAVTFPNSADFSLSQWEESP